MAYISLEGITKRNGTCRFQSVSHAETTQFCLHHKTGMGVETDPAAPRRQDSHFTQDNATAYQLGTRFFLPVLTHQTKLKERNAFLNGFRDGTYSILVTSKVLNEGIDVPEANVAIIVSGSGSVREHVQRLGRILRKREGKQAVLYELISKQTGEHFVNRRRRQHHAYQTALKIRIV